MTVSAEVTRNASSSGSFGSWAFTVVFADTVRIKKYTFQARIARAYSLAFNGVTVGSATTTAADQNCVVTLTTPYVLTAGDSLLVTITPAVAATLYFRNNTVAPSGTGAEFVTSWGGFRAPATAAATSSSHHGVFEFDVFPTWLEFGHTEPACPGLDLPARAHPDVRRQALDDMVDSIDTIRLLSALGDDTTPGTEVDPGVRFTGVSWTLTDHPLGVGMGGGGGDDDVPVYLPGRLLRLARCEPVVTFDAPTSFGPIVGWEGWDAAGTTRLTWGALEEEVGEAVAATDRVERRRADRFTPHTVMVDDPSDAVAALGDPTSRRQDGDQIVFLAGHTPAGLTAGTTYVVRDADATGFKVAATAGGAALDITSDGTDIAWARSTTVEGYTGLYVALHVDGF